MKKTREQRAAAVAALNPLPEELQTVSRDAAIRFLDFAQGTGEALKLTNEQWVMRFYLAAGLSLAAEAVDTQWPKPADLFGFVLANGSWARGSYITDQTSPKKLREYLAGLIACRIACKEITRLGAIRDLPKDRILDRLMEWETELRVEEFCPSPSPYPFPDAIPLGTVRVQAYPGAEPRTISETPLETPPVDDEEDYTPVCVTPETTSEEGDFSDPFADE